MLVSELRQLLKKYSGDDLRLIIAEMYKSMPKGLREENGIDLLLQDPHSVSNAGRIRKNQEKIGIDDLKNEIDQFVQNAYKSYYYAPNRSITKKERSGWRFKVRAFIKDLRNRSVDGEEGAIATGLLEKLYQMLCYACGTYIFRTEDPFRSVGIDQTELLDVVISRKLDRGINQDSIKSAITLVINTQVDRETLPSFLIKILVKNLESADAKEMAIEVCERLKAEIVEKKINTIQKSMDFRQLRL